LFPWRSRYRALAIAVGLLVLFVLFPPFGNHVAYSVETMGYLDKAARVALPEAARIVVFYCLALITCLRFGVGILPARPSLAAWLVIANTLVLMKGILAWDKYALPLLVTLWYLEARRSARREG